MHALPAAGWFSHIEELEARYGAPTAKAEPG